MEKLNIILTNILYYNIFFYYNMTDYSFNTIIDTSTLQIGQVVRINFTDEGIFRVFYNDTNGNMYCGLSRQSNYKQSIFDTSDKRTELDVSVGNPLEHITRNKFNPPFYGGTYHKEQVRFPSDLSGEIFYIFQYDTPGVTPIVGNSNHTLGPWQYFSEIQNEIYIKQGSTSGTIYDSNGYSTILADGKNSFTNENNRPHPSYYFYNQYAFCTGSTYLPYYNRAITKGIGLPFPDTLDIWGQDFIYNDRITVTKALNTNKSYLTNLSDISSGIVTGISKFVVTSIPFSENLKTNNALNIQYTIANKRSKYVWLDNNNNSTSNTDGEVGVTDTYYKGNFYIYANTYKDNDLSGNIYIEKRQRTTNSTYAHKLYTNFANTNSVNTDISNIFVDLDLDISKNSTINSGNFNYIYSKPYYVMCSDASGQVVYGNTPYDLN